MNKWTAIFKNVSILLGIFIIANGALFIACGGAAEEGEKVEQKVEESEQSLIFPGEENYLANIRQLTFGGQNAEAYFSKDGSKLIFQSTRDTFDCDQIFMMNADGSDVELVSTGLGRTTCAFIAPDGEKIVYSSTHLADSSCPEPPDMSQGYVWAVHPGYDIFRSDPDGRNLERLTINPRYDAEAVYSPDGEKIVFTSLREGDLDIYIMNPDGSGIVRVTEDFGYDGGAFFSPDSKWLCYRGYHPTDSAEVEEYTELLNNNLVRPGNLDIFIIRPDGSERTRVTDLEGANFCPYFHPDGERIIFASNHHTGDRNFDLFIINIDGTGLKQITFSDVFEGFPMFSYDGSKLVFASNRNATVPGETNVFIADWVEEEASEQAK